MSKQIWQGVYATFAGRRVSADTSSLSLSASRETVDVTTVEDRAMRYDKGLMGADISWSGFVDSDMEALQLRELAADQHQPFLAFKPPGTRGEHAVFLHAHLSGLGSIGADQGQAATFDVSVMPDGRQYLTGSVLYNGAGADGSVSASGSTSGVELGALGSGQVLGWCVAIPDPPGVSGTTVTLRVGLESDVDSSFSAPTVRATSSLFVEAAPGAGEVQMPGAEILEIDGDVSAVTDTWWRLSWTVAGTSPLVYPMVAAAIVPK